MRTGLTLYGYLDSGNGYKIRLLLAQLSRPYTYRELDITKGASRTPEFLRKNPNGRTPTLELDARVGIAFELSATPLRGLPLPKLSIVRGAYDALEEASLGALLQDHGTQHFAARVLREPNECCGALETHEDLAFQPSMAQAPVGSRTVAHAPLRAPTRA